MKLTRLIAAAMLLFGMLAALAGCSAEEYEPLELIPENSEIVGQVKISEIMRDYKIYYELTDDTESAAAVDKVKEEFADNTGIDIDDVSEIFLFGSMNGASSDDEMGNIGMIMTGNFADRDLVDTIAEKTGQTFTSSKYGSHTIYTGSENQAIVKVNSTLIVLGAEAEVKDCIDVIDGKKDTVSGTVVDNFENLGDVMFRISMMVPEQATETFDTDETSMMPMDLDTLTEIETLGVSGEMTVTSFNIKANFGFTSVEAAEEATELFQLIFGVFSMLAEEDEAAEILGRIDVTSEEASMIMTMEVPLEELASMIESMGSDEESPFSPFLPGSDSTGGIAIPPSSSGK